MAGSRGPIGKQPEQRRRRNKPQETTKARSTPKATTNYSRVPVPRVDSRWHPVAKRWYQALKGSAQAQFYEPSDWALAQVLAESISRELNPQKIVVGKGDNAKVVEISMPPRGASLAAWLKGMTALMVSEGDRRRLQLELQRPDPAAAGVEGGGSVSWLDDARSRLRDGDTG